MARLHQPITAPYGRTRTETRLDQLAALRDEVDTLREELAQRDERINERIAEVKGLIKGYKRVDKKRYHFWSSKTARRATEKQEGPSEPGTCCLEDGRIEPYDLCHPTRDAYKDGPSDAEYLGVGTYVTYSQRKVT